MKNKMKALAKEKNGLRGKSLTDVPKPILDYFERDGIDQITLTGVISKGILVFNLPKRGKSAKD